MYSIMYSSAYSFHYKYMYFIQFVRIAIFMSLHGPAVTCITVASASPIHVPPVQRVLKQHNVYLSNII